MLWASPVGRSSASVILKFKVHVVGFTCFSASVVFKVQGSCCGLHLLFCLSGIKVYGSCCGLHLLPEDLPQWYLKFRVHVVGFTCCQECCLSGIKVKGSCCGLHLLPGILPQWYSSSRFMLWASPLARICAFFIFVFPVYSASPPTHPLSPVLFKFKHKMMCVVHSGAEFSL